MSSNTCSLCSLPLRNQSITDTIGGVPLAFCCQGCRMVYSMLLEAAPEADPATFAETDLYRQCVAAGVIPASETDLERIRQEEEKRGSTGLPSDKPATPPEAADTLALDLVVSGMWCPACAWVIQKALSGLPGVVGVDCHFSTDRLRCSYRPQQVAPDDIRAAATRLGYTVEEPGASGEGRYQRRELIRLSLTGLLSANVMMLSWALFAGFFTELSADAVAKISWPIVIMTLAAFIYGGGPLLRKAWAGLIHGSPGMETLVGVAASVALGYSMVNWLAGSIHLYFDTACMLITLVLLGKYLEQQARSRVRRDLDAFFALQPTKVRLINKTTPAGRYTAIEQLAPGDRFAVESGEIVPADGRVIAGRASLDESALSGEPRPVDAKTGDAIKSGSRIIQGRIEVRADAVGSDTILGRMIAIMTASLQQKDNFTTRTDRMLRGFVPLIVLLAFATGLGGFLLGLTVDQAMVRAVTVLVISCPCALGVAIPMARLAGISRAGRMGILVRDGDAFERAGSISTVVFDKTGTLTCGRWQLNQVQALSDHEPDVLLALAAGLEQGVDHEVARSILAHARHKGIQSVAVTNVQAAAEGMQGHWANSVVRIGSRPFAWGTLQTGEEIGSTAVGSPASRVFLSVDGRPAAILHFGDQVRPSAKDAIMQLTQRYGPVHLISGDGDVATGDVARKIGIDTFQGGLLPDDKADYIARLGGDGQQVAMVGDGINDAAALAGAYLAVAVHSGGSLAQEAAHITLMRADPTQLMDFIQLSGRVQRKVVQNLWCAWIYNLIAIPVAMAGLLTPLVAATAMLLSSLTVIMNTLFLLKKGKGV